MDLGRGTRAQVIARELREAILSGRIRPGSRLPQEEVAERYGASRVPVQQALRELADEGLVTLVPNSGARVTIFDLNDLIETYRGRESLEPMVLMESVPRLTDADLAEVEALVLETERCFERDDRLAYVMADRPLHFATFRGADMPRMLRIIEGFWDTTQQYRRIYGGLPASVETSVIEHRLLLEHIQKRNAEDAGRLLISHIRRTRLSMTEYVEQLENDWSGELRVPLTVVDA